MLFPLGLQAPVARLSGIFCARVVGHEVATLQQGVQWDRLASSVPGWRNGIRGGLKIPCPQGRAGSTPAPGTNRSPVFMRVFWESWNFWLPALKKPLCLIFAWRWWASFRESRLSGPVRSRWQVTSGCPVNREPGVSRGFSSKASPPVAMDSIQSLPEMWTARF
jgi:hypothetical protein